MGNRLGASAISEFGLIDAIRRLVRSTQSVKRGIGDDAAVIAGPGKEDLLLTTDMLVEDVHFTKRDPARLIGRKSLACSISDIAAMGGLPTYALVSLGVPGTAKVNFCLEIYRGMESLARSFGVAIVGGDTVKSQKVVINVTLLGKVRKGQAVLRSGAQKGDYLFVTGPLGQSLKSGRHLTFTPRIKEAAWLCRHARPSAMIDISDGLLADLGHILEESRTGAVIFEDFVPLNKEADLDEALRGGEDFELLFTLPPARAKKLLAMKKTPFRFYHIGEITGDKGKQFLIDHNRERQAIVPQGYRHF